MKNNLKRMDVLLLDRLNSSKANNISKLIGGGYEYVGTDIGQEEWLGQVLSNTPDLYEPACRLVNNDGTDEELEDLFSKVEIVYPWLIVYV